MRINKCKKECQYLIEFIHCSEVVDFIKQCNDFNMKNNGKIKQCKKKSDSVRSTQKSNQLQLHSVKLIDIKLNSKHLNIN